MNFAVIHNQESGKNVAIFVHDPETGRLIYKVRPADALLQKMLDILSDRSVVVTEEDAFHGYTKRRRILRTDDDYLRHFVDKTIHTPYEIKSMEMSDDIDSADLMADQLYDEKVSFRGAL